MNILAIGTSNNAQSINRTLAGYTANLVKDASVNTVDIAELEMPLFSDAREKALGRPEHARTFHRMIGEADALVISFAEHNGSYTAAWKNLFDWTSRIDKRVFQNKPVLYLSTSPGPGGAASVLKAARESAPYFGARLVDAVSVPSFHDNYDPDRRDFTDPAIRQRLQRAAADLGRTLSASAAIQPEAATA